MNKGKIVVFTGPSGVGKGTVRDLFFNEPKFNLVYSISSTTRKPRKGEKEGTDYYFLSHAKFEELVSNNEFVEHASFAGNSYGTLKSEVNNQVSKGKNVFLEIEPQGGLQVINLTNYNIVTIFIAPPSLEELEKRLRNRASESEKDIINRLSAAKEEIEIGKSHYKYFVVNDDIDQCAKEIFKILESELENEV